MTERQAVVELIELSAQFTKQPIWALWRKLYDEFERVDGKAVYRVAHNTFRTELDTVEEEGWMPLLLARAQQFLKFPALPDNKKAPDQGSLFNEGEAK